MKGLVIEVPIIESIDLNEDFEFHIHVFNASNSYPFFNNEIDSCSIHLYSPVDGEHLVRAEMGLSGDMYDFEYYVEGGNFSVVGQYALLYYCNLTTPNGEVVGGFFEHPIVVSVGGGLSDVFVYILILAVIFGLFLLLIWINIKFNKKNREKLYRKIVDGYLNFRMGRKDNNLGYVILYALAYGLLENLLVFYWLITLCFLFVFNEMLYAFQITTLQTLVTTFLSVYFWGFVPVFIVFIFKFMQFFLNSLDDITKSMRGIVDGK